MPLLTNLPHLLFAWATPLEEFMFAASRPVTLLIISFFLIGAVLIAIRASSQFNRQLALVLVVTFLITLLVGIVGRIHYTPSDLNNLPPKEQR